MMSPLYYPKFCNECKKATLHKFISIYPFENSYWQCSECYEKQSHAGKKEEDEYHYDVRKDLFGFKK